MNAWLLRCYIDSQSVRFKDGKLSSNLSKVDRDVRDKTTSSLRCKSLLNLYLAIVLWRRVAGSVICPVTLKVSGDSSYASRTFASEGLSISYVSNRFKNLSYNFRDLRSWALRSSLRSCWKSSAKWKFNRRYLAVLN